MVTHFQRYKCIGCGKEVLGDDYYDTCKYCFLTNCCEDCMFIHACWVTEDVNDILVCELCGTEIEDFKVCQCGKCGLEGICDGCLFEHSCGYDYRQ